MNLYDKEIEIITLFQSVPTKFICLMADNSEIIDVVNSILDMGKWNSWTDSSAKDAPPPDFYCDNLKLMMDVMRVDDHERISEKGKTVNPTRAMESALYKGMQEKSLFANNPNVKLQILASTELPTDEDHNYSFYLGSFKRTVESHIKKIANYKQNHPGYKIIFFVFDESSAYFATDKKQQKLQYGECFEGEPHYWFLDQAFLSAFTNADIDFLIWYTPYKHCNAFDEEGHILDLPQAVVFDVKDMRFPQRDYDEHSMESAEV